MKQQGKPSYRPTQTAQAPSLGGSQQVSGSAPLAVADEMSSDAGALIAGGGTLQKLGTGYASAVRVQVPRDLELITKRVLAEAAFAAEDFFYFWEVNKTDSKTGEITKEPIEGPSIHAAMILVRNWGNCAVPMELSVDGPQHWVLKACFVDFETGFNLERLFRQRKQGIGGKYENERQMDMSFQMGQSKAQRNVVEKAMPIWLVRDAMAVAKDAARKRNGADIERKTGAAIERFGKRNITKEQLEKKVGSLMGLDTPLPAEQWDAECHVRLTGLWNALKDRQTTLAAEFGGEEPKGATTTEQATEQAGAAASAATQSTAAASDAGGSETESERQPGEDDR